MRTHTRLLLLLCSSLLLASCSFSTFDLVEQNFEPKGKTIAVLPGLNHEANVLVAHAMSVALKKNSRFRVVSQKRVAGIVPNYPPNIKGPYRSAYFEIEIDYTKTDRKKIKRIQRKLGVDYLYVIWAPTATTVQKSIHQLHLAGQMFEAPQAKEVGHGRFYATAGRVGCMMAPTPGADDQVKAIKDSTDHVSKEIAKKMGMLK